MKRNRIGLGAVALMLVACVTFGAALSAERNTRSTSVNRIHATAYTNVVIYTGALVAINSSGYAVPASDATGLSVVGRCAKTVDNTGGASGALGVDIDVGTFYWENAGDVGKEDIGQIVYVVNDQTVSVATNGTYNVVAGVVVDYDSVLDQVVVQTGNFAASSASAPSSLAVTGAATVGTTLAVTGVATFTDESVHNGGIDADYITTDAGAGIDVKTAGALKVGTATATSVDIGVVSTTQALKGNGTVAGTFAVTGATTLNGAVTLGDATNDVTTITSKIVHMANLPTATNGLTTGDLWNSSGTVTVY